jgi:5-methylcytosine-specific restriction endonuclease McrA
MNKTQRLERIRGILDNYAINVVFAPEDVESLNNLTGWSFTHFKKVINPRTPSETRCLAVSNDGTSYEVWSWRKAVTPVDNKTPALRSAIQYQLDKFMKEWAPVCVSCGKTKDLTVDHRNVPFSLLATTFLVNNPNLEINNDNSGNGWVIKDTSMLELWQNFHAERATYQILCRSCNATKGIK